MIASKLRTSRGHRAQVAANLDRLFVAHVHVRLQIGGIRSGMPFARTGEPTFEDFHLGRGVKCLHIERCNYGQQTDLFLEVPAAWTWPDSDNRVTVISIKKVRRT